MGKKVQIWNGKEFSIVIPKITGRNQPMVKVCLSNGTSLPCTRYHEWVLKGGQHIKAIDLKPGMILECFDMPVIDCFSKKIEYAYDLGLFAGDGSFYSKEKDAGILLYGKKRELINHLTFGYFSVGSYNSFYDRTWVGFHNYDASIFKKDFVPFNYTVKTRLSWLAGLIDSDGCVAYGMNNINIQITSINKEFLLNVRKMLTTLGVQSTVGIMLNKGKRLLLGGKNKEKKYYDCKTVYRLSISTRNVDHLISLGLHTYRVDIEKVKTRTRYTERFIRIKNVIPLSKEKIVYCFNEPKNHTGTFEGIVTGQCFEQCLESGECCCLVETFPSLHESYEEYEETLKYAYMYAKTVNLLPTHWPETNAIMMKNRRIGTSMSGIIDSFVKHGRREMLDWCDHGYDYLKKLDKIYSDWLCVPISIRITSIKPSGTVSLLPGVSPGVHYHHSEYYIRRIRIASDHPLVTIMKDAGYEVEFSAYGLTEEEKKLTSVISFPVHIKNFDRKKADVSIWEQVKNAIDLQRFWSDNSVSITVTFKEDEKQDIAHVLEAYEDSLKAISFLPLKDHGYIQAPYEEITKEKYEEMMENIKEPNFNSLFIQATGDRYMFCDGDKCLLQ